MSHQVKLSAYGSTLATRHRAQQVGEELASIKSGQAVALDFSGVRAASNSFVDELVAIVTAEAAARDISVEIVGVSEDIARALERVMARRNPAGLSLVVPA